MSTERQATPLRVYWQPGCTSCLRAREFLAANGIEFDSINVRERPEAMAELAALGARTVPVIARGADFVLGQDIDELARFAGLTVDRMRLSPDELAARLQLFLDAAARLLQALPAERLGTKLPQRERTWLDLGFHVAMIVQGLLEAGSGGALAYEHYERRAPAGWADAAPAAAMLRATAVALDRWWREARPAPEAMVATYFGPQITQALLERTAWHVAQHCRQLESLVHEVARVPGAPRLPPQALDGLPVPTAVWDPEIRP